MERHTDNPDKALSQRGMSQVGVADVENYLQLMKAFFGRFAELEGKCNFGLDFGAVRLASMSVCQPSVKAPAA